MGNAFKMAEITDFHRNLHVLTLDYVGMAAPAVQPNAPPHLGEVRLVVKTDVPFRHGHLGFYEPFIMAPGLKTILIRDVREGTLACASREKLKLCCKGGGHVIFMAFEAGDFVMSRRLPFRVIWGHEMTYRAVFWLREYNLQ
jgi:hypothetical protein